MAVRGFFGRLRATLTPPRRVTAPMISRGKGRLPGPLAWAGRGEPGEDSYRRNVVVHRAVSLTARALATIPWTAYDAKGQEISDPAFTRLIGQPNPMQDGTALLEAVATDLLLTGNGFVEALTVPGDRRPRELHRLRPDRLRVVPGPGGVPAAYDYSADGVWRSIAVDPLTGACPLLHLRLFDPLDDWRGLSPLAAAALAVEQHDAASRWNKALLDHAARPSGALVYQPKDGPAALSDEQFERLKSEIAAQFEGADNAGRPLLLDGGLDWRALSLSPSDMDWLAGRNAAARDIALAFGVPPQLVGVPDAQTYANYAEARLAFYEDTVVPLARLIARAFTRLIGPPFAIARLEPDLDEVPALEPRRAERWQKIAASRDLTVNERRAALGYGPLSDGDRIDNDNRSA